MIFSNPLPMLSFFKRFHKKSFFFWHLALILAVLGQAVFWVASPRLMETRHAGEIFATMGVEWNGTELHHAHEAAHFFQNTVVGWLKFPHFDSELKKAVPTLPPDAGVSGSLQERQNMVIRVESAAALTLDSLRGVQDFVQARIDAYNQTAGTAFLLANTDLTLSQKSLSYFTGALATLFASLVLALAIQFIRREF